MEKTKKEQKNEILTEKELYKQKIVDIVDKIDNTWMLKEILRFAENIKN